LTCKITGYKKLKVMTLKKSWRWCIIQRAVHCSIGFMLSSCGVFIWPIKRSKHGLILQVLLWMYFRINIRWNCRKILSCMPQLRNGWRLLFEMADIESCSWDYLCVRSCPSVNHVRNCFLKHRNQQMNKAHVQLTYQ
jgi:hypothetical protein